MSQQPNPIVSHGEEADLGGVGGGASSFAGGLLPGDVHVNHTPGAKLLCQLMWEYYDGMDKVDLDCSAICFDETGTIMDAVYYNCLSILDGCIVHSGDSREGAKDGVDESITVDLDRLPVSAKVIVFVINAHSGGTLDSVESANASSWTMQGRIINACGFNHPGHRRRCRGKVQAHGPHHGRSTEAGRTKIGT